MGLMQYLLVAAAGQVLHQQLTERSRLTLAAVVAVLTRRRLVLVELAAAAQVLLLRVGMELLIQAVAVAAHGIHLLAQEDQA